MKDNFTNFYIKRALIVLGALSIISALFIKNPKPFILGLVFSGSINILLFKVMFLNLDTIVEYGPRKAQMAAVMGYLLRYLIYGTVLVISAKADYINFIAAVIGLYIVKFVILGSNIIDYRLEKGGKK